MELKSIVKKEITTGWNTHFRQNKNVKIEFFFWGCTSGTWRKAKRYAAPPPPKLPTWKAHKIHLLVFNLHVHYKENSQFNYFFLFRPWYTNPKLNEKCILKIHCILSLEDTSYKNSYSYNHQLISFNLYVVLY